ncbi:hypothetical protein FB451DRAFT_1230710 [Mycena latifolia]|nr:hypothetical protein FB451DRAFT_1230710 [Mycena latifolia]
MSPSMPITITSPASARTTSSVASSPSSSSTSSAGVYVPVHRRTPSNAAPEPKRTLPIYTPAELMGLAQSPLAKEQAKAMAGVLQGQAVALSRKQQRAREYKVKTQSNAGENEDDTKLKDNTNVVTVVPAVAPRRRPVGRAAERSSNSRRGGATRFVDAASWRVQAASLRQPVV